MSRMDASLERSEKVSPVNTSWSRRLVLLFGGVAVVLGCWAIRRHTGDVSAGAQSGGRRGRETASKSGGQDPAAKRSRPEHPQHDVMAIVNGKDISRQRLSLACVERFGEEVLEGLINRRLILHHCRKRKIEVSSAEIDAEIERMAKRFKLGREQWLELLERERGIGPEEYGRDIIWPTLALRRLAVDQLQVSDEELRQAYETRYGASVRARLIIVEDQGQAGQLRRQLVDRPDEFARLAMQHSRDVNSASIGGLIQPIRQHVGDSGIERAVFALQPDEISPVIPVSGQFALLKCEGHIPPRNIPLNDVRNELAEQIKEGKLRKVASQLFEQLQNAATIQNVWNDPQLRERMPGIVATVNGEQITMKELGDECLLRNGRDVLEVEITQLLLEQALTQAGLTVEQADLDAEVSHAAELSGVVDSNGQPDLEQWFQVVTEEQGVTREIYTRDSVWPSAALKKLTGGQVEVTTDDIRKGFDANYGERVRCRAIVLQNMRKAQEVWAKARQNPSLDYFCDLAEEYSTEPTSKSLRGEVPPIRRHGGQPELEKVAFELQPGELSGIVQLGDRFAILKCEGRTEPVEVNPDEVRDILYQDIFEKKMRLVMGQKYETLREKARIDNYLAGTSQAPGRSPVADSSGGPRRDAAVRPTSGTTPR